MSHIGLLGGFAISFAAQNLPENKRGGRHKTRRFMTQVAFQFRAGCSGQTICVGNPYNIPSSCSKSFRWCCFCF